VTARVNLPMMSRTNSSAGTARRCHPHRQGLLEQHSESVPSRLVSHCGGVSQWSVASGGRMGQVMGEDATEIAPAATCAPRTAWRRIKCEQGRRRGISFPRAGRVRFETAILPRLRFPVVVARTWPPDEPSRLRDVVSAPHASDTSPLRLFRFIFVHPKATGYTLASRLCAAARRVTLPEALSSRGSRRGGRDGQVLLKFPPAASDWLCFS